MKPLYLAWIIACLIILRIAIPFNKETTDFHAIAETGEIIINSEHPVEVKKLHVLSGQAVKKGELLVAFERPDLTVEINRLMHQVEELKTRKKVDIDEIRSEVWGLEAEKARKTGEFNYRIQLLRSRLAVNTKLAAGLKSIRSSRDQDADEAVNPMEMEIGNLKKELALSIHPIQIRIDLLKNEITSPEDPKKVRLERLEKELEFLLAEKSGLYIHVPISGIVGSVNVKVGEKVPPFTPILTLHAKSPSYVKGFIHENVYNRISVDDTVAVISSAAPERRIKGRVVGVGTRIVAFPERLKNRPGVGVWGREVQISIPGNDFLLGEKVLVRKGDGKKGPVSAFIAALLPFKKIHAQELKIDGGMVKSDPVEIRFALPLKDTVTMEASGSIYLPDLKRYIVISDETRDDLPFVYLMDNGGNIEGEVTIRGLDRIEDMESIAQDERGFIYIACSQGLKKNGKLPDKRKLLVRLKRDTGLLTLDKGVNLHDLLVEKAEGSNAPWATFFNGAYRKGEIDIEAMFVHGGNLYLGFKSPLNKGCALVLEIADIDTLFAENRIAGAKIWRALDLSNDGAMAPQAISDMCRHENRLFILSYGRKKSGNLWTCDMAGKSISHLAAFDGLKSEGVAVNTDTGELLIAFDAGEKMPSRIMKIRGVL